MYATEINGGDRGANADSITATYRANAAAFGFPWAKSAQGGYALSALWDSSEPISLDSITPWVTGEKASVSGRLPWLGYPDAVIKSAAAWAKAENGRIAIVAPWEGTPREAIANLLNWADSIRAAVPTDAAWTATMHGAISTRLPWNGSPRLTKPIAILYQPGAAGARAWRLPWQKAGKPLWFHPQLIIDPDDPDQGGGNDPETGTWIIFRKKAYRMFHEVSLKRLPDLLPVPASGLSFTLSADNPHLSFSAEVLGRSAFESILPSEGSAMLVQADIDGMIVNIVLDPSTASQSFNADRFAISGRSITWYLGAPYNRPRDKTSDDDYTAQQLALAEFDGLLTTGWSLTWADGGDWLIPAGGFSYANQTPIQAIQTLAQGGGLIVVPSLTGKSLDVRYRYPVMPWDYGTATPDLIIPTSVALSIPSKAYDPATYDNAIYVVGGNVGGVMARVWRSGTAGDRLMQQVQNDLATTAPAAYEIGRRALAGQWKQPIIREIEIPFDNLNFPLAELGWLVKVQDSEDGNVFGVVSGVTIAVTVQPDGLVEISQSIRLGENSGDPLTLFNSLLPSDPLLFGEVVAVYADGTVMVQQPGGGVLRVRGTGVAEGATVFVRSGKIESVAAAMTLYDLEA